MDLLDQTCYQKYWDDRLNKYRNFSLDKVHKCCVRQCEEVNDICGKICQKMDDNKCSDHCMYGIKSCLGNCDVNHLLRGSTAKIGSCIDDSICKEFVNNEEKLQDCLTENRESLIKCCREQCIPTQDVDCDEHCNNIFDHYHRSLMYRDERPIVQITHEKNANSGINVPLIVSLVLLLILLGVALIIKRMSKN